MAVASFQSLFRRPFLLLNNGSTRRLRQGIQIKNAKKTKDPKDKRPKKTSKYENVNEVAGVSSITNEVSFTHICRENGRRQA